MSSRRLDADDVCPVRDGFAMPAEWTAHARTWMAWPCKLEPWGSPEGMLRARVAHAQIARAISGFEKITMAVRPQDREEAQMACGKGIEFFEVPLDDPWARDIGPSFVVNEQEEVAGVYWRFNAWGNKYISFESDVAFGRRVLDALDMRGYEGPMVLEGGSVSVDGRGTLMTTEQCLLNPNRNPNLTQQQIEERLALFLGVNKVIWLGAGLADDETDGHVDNVACFAGSNRILLHMPKNGENLRAMQDNRARLKAARDVLGRPFEVIELPEPEAQERHNGQRLEMSYVNFYFTNYGLVMPAFDDPADAEVASIMAKVFPDRRIVQVPALDIVQGGGGIHCITQQQPAGRPVTPSRTGRR